jgi:hypothetical protein
MDLFRQLCLEGQVVAATTDGEMPYLVVRVAGLAEAVIVPTDKTTVSRDDERALAAAAI